MGREPTRALSVNHGRSSGFPVRDGRLRKLLLALVFALLAFVLFVVLRFFETLPIENTGLAIDWKGIWVGISDGRPSYQTGLRVPPWGAILLLPFGLLSMRVSWGLVTLATIAALVACVPTEWSRWRKLFVGLLVATSYSTLRHVADGNLEFLMIAGILLGGWALSRQSCWGLAGAILLMTLKIQETWVLLGVIGIHVLKTWPRRKWLTTSGIVVLVAAPALVWLGGEWWAAFRGIPHMGSLMDASLWAGMSRLGIMPGVIAVFWLAILAATILLARQGYSPGNRMWAGLLTSASLVLAPYAAGNSLLTVLAIGVVPLIAAWPVVGVGLFLLDDVKYFLPGGFILRWGALLATVQFLLIGAALYIRLRKGDPIVDDSPAR